MSDILSFFDWPTIDLDPLVLALSSLDINKMASKNLFYINRLQDIGRGVFENFWKFYFGQNKRIWYSEIPSSIPHFSNVFRIHSNQSWNFLEFIFFWAKSERLKVNSTNAILLCKPKFISFFHFWPLLNPFCLFNFFQTHLYGAYNKKEVRNVYYHIRKPFP